MAKPVQNDAPTEPSAAALQATRDILDAIHQHRDDEIPIFEAILDHACRLSESPFAFVCLVDDASQTIGGVINKGGSPTFAARSRTVREPLNCSLTIAQAIREARTINVEDLWIEDGDPGKDHPVRIATLAEGVRSILFVPLVRDGIGIGCIAIYRREVRSFEPSIIALIETFASQAVIAIENVRQFREVQQRLEREAASAEILEVISRSRDDDRPVFDVILRNAARLCKLPHASLALVQPDRKSVKFAAIWGGEAKSFDLGEEWSLDLPNAVPTSIRESRTVQAEDLTKTDLYIAGDETTVRTVEKEGVLARLSVPLISDGAAIGAILLSRREAIGFTNEEIALIQTFAAQAVIAIENVRQFKALEALNAELGDRVQDQVGEIERMGRLKRFLPAAVADAVVTSGDESMLTSHRAMVATLFCDMRGFTAFCEAAEPEETIEVLQTYHQEMSDLIDEYGGGVDQRAGDAIMVIFNDPIQVDDPAGDAVRLAIAMREKMRELCAQWKRLGHRLGFGVGISLGYATVGMVGSAGRFDYTASGTSVNTAARLCDMAADGEILISPRVWVAVEGDFQAESRGEVEMKGIREPVEVFAVG